MSHESIKTGVFTPFLNLADGFTAEDKTLKDLFFQALDQVSAPDLFIEYMGLRARIRQIGLDAILNLIDTWEPRLNTYVAERRGELSEEEVALTKARGLIATTEHPEIKENLDEDITDYYKKRELKDMEAAKTIYSRLQNKYPGHEDRLNLMRYARTGNSLFSPFFQELKNRLADRYILGIRKSILYILACFSESGGRSALDLFSKIRMAVKILPSDRKKAVRVLDRMQTYAKALDFHPQAFASMCELLEDYYGESLFTKKEVKLVLPVETGKDSEQIQAFIQTFDVQKVTFTPEDLAAILINPKITGSENITLTYCWQYWLRTSDPDFENKVYLYSLKHQSQHSTIFQAVKKGRDSGVKDSDILYAVYNIVGRNAAYEYNVRKDIYMQHMWLRIKPGQDGPIIGDKRAWAEEQIRIAKERKAKTLLVAAEKSAVLKAEREQSKVRAMDQVKRMKERDQHLRRLADAKVQAHKASKEESKAKAVEKVRVERERDKPAVVTLKPVLEKNLGDEWKAYEGEQKVTPLLEVLSQIDKTEQKNLHLVFRRRLEGEIFAFLDEYIWDNKLQLKSVNKTLAAMAIKDFIFAHLDKTARNWSMSNERLKVRDQGLLIDDIEPIIENCLKHLPQAGT